MEYYKPGKKALFILLLVFWLIINLLQAIYTEVNPDEAYYFLYGKYLAWGYFDHPPMVALMVRISSWLFSGNLGLRFITVLLQIPTLMLIWLQIDKSDIHDRRSVLFFFAISASLVMFVVSGFTTTPDAPLLFFTALFLYAYKKFLNQDSWAFAFLIAISMSGLIYSKYQGVLIIGFVVLSNIRLLINPRFLVASLLALALCTPHFYWQYSHDFPSFKYHLIKRLDPFKWRFFFEYWPNQLATFNPFTFIAVLYVLYKYRAKEKFERAQYFIIIGVLLFFWMSTFKNHAEPQWTMAASVPIIILLCNKVAVDNWLRKYVQRFVAGSLLLIFIARILIASNLLPAKLDFHGKHTRYDAINKIAKDKPVIFSGSYQNPSLYTFFTHRPATVISSIKSRQTQFDMWRFEQDWYHQTVFIHGVFEGRSKEYKVGDNIINGFFADSIQTTHLLNIEYTLHTDSLKAGDSVNVSFTIENPTQNDVNFSSTQFPVKIQLIILSKTEVLKIDGKIAGDIAVLKRNVKMSNEIKFSIPALPKGDYKFGLGCHTIFGWTLNSDTKNITLF